MITIYTYKAMWHVLVLYYYILYVSVIYYIDIINIIVCKANTNTCNMALYI